MIKTFEELRERIREEKFDAFEHIIDMYTERTETQRAMDIGYIHGLNWVIGELRSIIKYGDEDAPFHAG